MNNRMVINVTEDELGIRRARKEADAAYKRGKKVAFDLRDIQDRKKQVDIIMQLSSRK